MEYSSFCILGGVLYMCTSDVGSLLGYLGGRGLDVERADQGRIHHTSPDDFLIICSSSVEKVVSGYLSDILKGELHFRSGYALQYNTVVDKIEYVFIEKDIFLTGIEVLKVYNIGEGNYEDSGENN